MTKKRKKPSVLLLILLLLAVLFFSSPYLLQLIRQGIVPGPEGVVLYNYGFHFATYSNTFHKLGTFSTDTVLESGEYREYNWAHKSCEQHDLVVKSTRPEPKNLVLKKIWDDDNSRYATLVVEHSRPSVGDADYRGVIPAGYPASEPTYLEYCKLLSQNETSKEWKKYCVYVVPVDFIIQVSVDGYRDLGWEDVHLWFVLDTNVWYDTFTEEQVKDQMLNPLPENSTLTAYDYRGGFPIFAWIAEWDPMVWGYVENDVEKGETENPPSEALDCVKVYPSLKGRELPLFTGDPAMGPYLYTLTLSRDILEGTSADDKIVELTPALPSPEFATTVYFSVTLEKFGPWTDCHGPFWDPWGDWEGWWPTSYMRVRVLYGIYGEFVYLWTKSEEEKWDYDWENRTSIHREEESWWTQLWKGIGDWWGGILRSPFTYLWVAIIGFFAILIVVATVAVFAPGVLAALVSTRRKKAKSGEG